MGVHAASLISQHQFRSQRRHAAKMKQDETISSLESQNQWLLSQVQSWECWYSNHVSSESAAAHHRVLHHLLHEATSQDTNSDDCQMARRGPDQALTISQLQLSLSDVTSKLEFCEAKLVNQVEIERALRTELAQAKSDLQVVGNYSQEKFRELQSGQDEVYSKFHATLDSLEAQIVSKDAQLQQRDALLRSYREKLEKQRNGQHSSTVDAATQSDFAADIGIPEGAPFSHQASFQDDFTAVPCGFLCDADMCALRCVSRAHLRISQECDIANCPEAVSSLGSLMSENDLFSQAGLGIGELVRVTGDPYLRHETGWIAGLTYDGRYGIASRRGGCMFVRPEAVTRMDKPCSVPEEEISRRISEARSSCTMFVP